MPTAQHEITNVGDPKDFFFSPDAGFEPDPAGPYEATPFPPLDESLVDTSYSARGLDSPSTNPLPSPLESMEEAPGYAYSLSPSLITQLSVAADRVRFLDF